MPLYNLTQVANSNSTLAFAQNVDTVFMNGWVGILILISLFGILMFNFIKNNNNPRHSLVGASFVCFVVAVLLRIMSLIDDKTIFICLILAAGTLSLTTWKET